MDEPTAYQEASKIAGRATHPFHGPPLNIRPSIRAEITGSVYPHFVSRIVAIQIKKGDIPSALCAETTIPHRHNPRGMDPDLL